MYAFNTTLFKLHVIYTLFGQFRLVFFARLFSLVGLLFIILNGRSTQYFRRVYQNLLSQMLLVHNVLAEIKALIIDVIVFAYFVGLLSILF